MLLPKSVKLMIIQKSAQATVGAGLPCPAAGLSASHPVNALCHQPETFNLSFFLKWLVMEDSGGVLEQSVDVAAPLLEHRPTSEILGVCLE